MNLLADYGFLWWIVIGALAGALAKFIMPGEQGGGIILTTVLGIGAVTTMTAHAAAAGCQVTYRVTNQWQGGFGADVSVRNLGDPLTSWTVGWSLAAGQGVTQAWNATVTTSGNQATARNVSYNGALGTGASTSFGFNGTWTGSNPVPTSFTVNGVACTGATAPVTTTPTTTPTSRPPTTAPTSRPPTTAPPGNPPSTTFPTPAGNAPVSNGTIQVSGSGQDFTVNGNSRVVCGNIQTANATVYLIDQVLLPKS